MIPALRTRLAAFADPAFAWPVARYAVVAVAATVFFWLNVGGK